MAKKILRPSSRTLLEEWRHRGDESTKLSSRRRGASALPGLVAAFVNGRPACAVHVLGDKTAIVIGRDAGGDVSLPEDEELSCRHVEVAFDGNVWSVRAASDPRKQEPAALEAR